MKNKNAKELLTKYAQGNCTAEELALIETWYVEDELQYPEITSEEIATSKRLIWQELPIHKNKQSSKIIKLSSAFNFINIAAALFIIASIALIVYVSNSKKINSIENKLANKEIVPGSTTATITLADGSIIDLTHKKNGLVKENGGVLITKNENGLLSYQVNEQTNTTKVDWNTLAVPAGGYYAVTLVDGSKVWLNSKSSLKFPTTFNGNERIVELKGEGYFEVMHKDDQPFKVISNGQTVEVLGTHFNINAYSDENEITTSLLEGKVSISLANGNKKILTPNYQSKTNGSDITIEKFAVENAIDWVNNDFLFENEELGSIMRKISRWYDIDVSCNSTLSKLKFSGSISRTKNIQQVLKIMELTGLVDFKIDGRRITVVK